MNRHWIVRFATARRVRRVLVRAPAEAAAVTAAARKVAMTDPDPGDVHTVIDVRAAGPVRPGGAR